jgi:MoxR-like ATPase
VIATQNPIEYEGTFPLPEAQLDRFLVKFGIGYPNPSEEQEILKRRTERKRDPTLLEPVVTPQVFSAMRQCIEGVYVHPDVQHYIVDLVGMTRQHRKVAIGASPRGSLALLKLARAWAALHGRNYVLPDDAKHLAQDALCHRIILEPALWGSKSVESSVIEEILETLAVPVIPRENE